MRPFQPRCPHTPPGVDRPATISTESHEMCTSVFLNFQMQGDLRNPRPGSGFCPDHCGVGSVLLIPPGVLGALPLLSLACVCFPVPGSGGSAHRFCSFVLTRSLTVGLGLIRQFSSFGRSPWRTLSSSHARSIPAALSSPHSGCAGSWR